VLLHGFGGTGLTYFRMFKALKNFYKVHALDTMGVGHSTKGKFKEDFTYD
jgi:pimeloyl-ACP methyl ester carboxylesterase